jgi:hypothetical protein
MTKTRFEALARRLALGLGLGAGACATNDPLPPAPPGPSTPAPNDPSAAAPAAGAAPAPAASAAAPSPRTRAELEAAAATDLARLRALMIVDVGDLVLDLPDASSACYGGTCPADVWDRMVTDEYARQVPRLDALTGLGARTVANMYPVPGSLSVAAQDVAALDALAIVHVRGLLVAQPASNPICYNTPCPEDVQAAAQTTSFRAGYLHAWTTLAEAHKP